MKQSNVSGRRGYTNSSSHWKGDRNGVSHRGGVQSMKLNALGQLYQGACLVQTDDRQALTDPTSLPFIAVQGPTVPRASFYMHCLNINLNEKTVKEISPLLLLPHAGFTALVFQQPLAAEMGKG